MDFYSTVTPNLSTGVCDKKELIVGVMLREGLFTSGYLGNKRKILRPQYFFKGTLLMTQLPTPRPHILKVPPFSSHPTGRQPSLWYVYFGGDSVFIL